MPRLARVTPGPVRDLRSATGAGTARVVSGLPPAAAKRVPVVVMPHGSAGDARTRFDGYGIHYYRADAVRAGAPAFAVARRGLPPSRAAGTAPVARGHRA
jgi:predicted dienelactone hydrolase